MGKGFFNVPVAINEPVKSYAPGSPERKATLEAYKTLYNSHTEVPLYINGAHIKTSTVKNVAPPHDHNHVVGSYHLADKQHVEQAISTALEARKTWSKLPWEN